MEQMGALAGIRVLDFTWAWAGPHCTRLLADLGAEVIRVESAERLDVLRKSGPWPSGEPGGLHRGGNFNQINRNKRSILLNLKNKAGLELAMRLTCKVDVVVSNFAAGVMERLGLSYEALKDVNSRVVWAAVSGFGQTGPQSTHVTLGPPMTMFSGLASITGYGPGDEPRLLGSTYCDSVAGNHAAIAILAALIQRQITGAGQKIDVSMLETTVSMLPEMILRYTVDGAVMDPMGNRDEMFWPQGCYRCDGPDSWIAITIEDETHWQALCHLIGRPDLAHLNDAFARRSDADTIDGAIADWAARRSPTQAFQELQRLGIPSAPANSSRDLVNDRHLTARGFWAAVNQPDVGNRVIAGPAFRMSETPLVVHSPAPYLGEHTADVLASLLGLSDTEISSLRDDGAFG